MTRIFIEFERGRVALEQATEALQNKGHNARQFLGEAERVVEGVPDKLPSVEEFQAAIAEEDPITALLALHSLAEYISSNSDCEYDFVYDEEDIERLTVTVNRIA